MIDLTLDSILIPDITGYTNPYNFGSKVPWTPAAKGGLSSRETTNNVIAAFGKMRAIAVSVNETTSNVEYDAKLYINAESSIILTLGNSTYYGCVVNIINSTNLTHTLVYTKSGSVQGTITLLPLVNFELMWNGTTWQNITAPAVGEFVSQYPTEKEPSLIYPCTSWIERIYNGAFFRGFELNVSNPFIMEGQTLTPQGYKTDVNGVRFTGSEVDTGTQSDNPDFSAETTHSHNTRICLGAAIADADHDGFQAPKTQSITGWHTETSETSTGYMTFSGSTSGHHSHSVTPTASITSTDTETRPKNYTFRIWERTA